MTAILVTGGTGTLGIPTVAALRAAGQWVRVLSRRTGPGLTTGDLVANVGLREALDGAHTVVHLATASNKTDVDAARNLFAAARQAQIRTPRADLHRRCRPDSAAATIATR